MCYYIRMNNTAYLNYKDYWNCYAKHQLTQLEEWLQESSAYSSMRKFQLTHIRLDWSTHRRFSRGGWYNRHGGAGVSMAMWHVCGRKAPNAKVPQKVYEYASYQDDSEIGNFYTDNTHDRLMMELCHEVAHAAQYTHKRVHNMIGIKPHGDVFKMFYREIRNQWLNTYLPDQNEMGRLYRDHRKMSVLQEFAI